LTYEQEVVGSEMSEIKKFVNRYYFNRLNKNISELYYKNNIDFYIQENISKKSYRALYSIDEYLEIQDNFLAKSGKMISVTFAKITFAHSVNDETITENNLYYVICDVKYQNENTKENFILKNTENGFKVYRYFIWIL
jgi:hypothetical protein